MSVATVVTDDGVVTVDGFASVIRYHARGAFGDPWTFSCVMSRHGDEATLFGGGGEMTPRIRRAIKAALVQLGVRRVRYERHKGAQTIEREIER